MPQHDLEPGFVKAEQGIESLLGQAIQPSMLAAFGRLREEGIEVAVHGDIFLEDLRAFRERLLRQARLEGRYPLWGRDSAELYDECLDLGAPSARSG